MNYSTRTEIRAQREPWVRDTISIRIAQIRVTDGRQAVSIAQPLTMHDLPDDGACRVQPETFALSPADAQQFMDELWRVGIRPTDGAGSVGQLAAIERHLEDMRSLVFRGGEGKPQ